MSNYTLQGIIYFKDMIERGVNRRLKKLNLNE